MNCCIDVDNLRACVLRRGGCLSGSASLHLAHDERLCCAKVGGRKNINYIRMVWMLERYLTENEFKRFTKELTELLMRYVETYAIKHVLNQIGFVELLQKATDGSLFE